jgi:putative transposase
MEAQAEGKGVDPLGSGCPVHEHGLGSFLRHHNLVHSMSRRGNCHDNAVAESFFNLLKRERIRRRVYRSRDEARQDVFDYIEMFYNPKRKHVRNGMLSPVEFEKQQKI